MFEKLIILYFMTLNYFGVCRVEKYWFVLRVHLFVGVGWGWGGCSAEKMEDSNFVNPSLRPELEIVYFVSLPSLLGLRLSLESLILELIT